MKPEEENSPRLLTRLSQILKLRERGNDDGAPHVARRYYERELTYSCYFRTKRRRRLEERRGAYHYCGSRAVYPAHTYIHTYVAGGSSRVKTRWRNICIDICIGSFVRRPAKNIRPPRGIHLNPIVFPRTRNPLYLSEAHVLHRTRDRCRVSINCAVLRKRLCASNKTADEHARAPPPIGREDAVPVVIWRSRLLFLSRHQITQRGSRSRRDSITLCARVSGRLGLDQL